MGALSGLVRVDGAMGEGGGQILRSALALAMVTGRPVEVDRIRMGRRKPGLLRQHLTGVRAAVEICDATVSGAALGSTRLRFEPAAIQPGDYRFSVGSAGSTALVLQTVLPALWAAGGDSLVEVDGGTHAESAPPFPFLDRCFGPAVALFGAPVAFELRGYGFFPAGGGSLRALVSPATWHHAELVARGPVRRVRPVAVVANLDPRIAAREAAVLCDGLGLPRTDAEVRSVASPGPGNAAWVELETETIAAVFSGFGRRGVPAERVAQQVVDQARGWLDAEVPVGPHLADQLLLPLAIGAGGVFRTVPLTPHSRTNIEVIQRFVDVAIDVVPAGDGAVEVRITP